MLDAYTQSNHQKKILPNAQTQTTSQYQSEQEAVISSQKELVSELRRKITEMEE